MSYRTHPDCIVPASEFRCEAMTKPISYTYQDWRRQSHRCVRRAVQGRDGKSVCALHSRIGYVIYWNGEPDTFPKKTGHRRWSVPGKTQEIEL